MDDLDHSMYLSEYDWNSFYEESEECCLLQPSLACPDDSGLVSDDSENTSSFFIIGKREPQPCLNEADSLLEGEQDNLITKVEEERKRQVKSDVCLLSLGGNIVNTEKIHMRTRAQATSDDITTTLHTVQLPVLSPDGPPIELIKQTGDFQAGSDSLFMREHCPTELNEDEPHTAGKALSQNVSSGTSTGEKERWFVTIDDSVARQRLRAASVKNKNISKNRNMYKTLRLQRSDEPDLEPDINIEPGGGRNKPLNQKSEGCPAAERNLKSLKMGNNSDSLQTSLACNEETRASYKLVTSHLTETTTDRNKKNEGSSAFTATVVTAIQLDSVDSDEFRDCVEILSFHSCDSENYVSASESLEDPQHLLTENQELQGPFVARHSSSLSLTENTDAEDTHDGEMLSTHNTLSCSITATECEMCGIADVDSTLTFPSAAHYMNKMSDGHSTCDNDTNCLQLCVPSDTPALQKHVVDLSASECHSGDGIRHPFVSEVNIMSCSVAESPESYALATGQTRPIYAISAFWDEMEKLTINDILQIRNCRNTPLRETLQTGSPLVEGFPTDHRFLVNTVEYDSSEANLMDASDTADSDYFMQIDETKPDPSSCEFSMSDFEEENWQFLGASRNTSPNHQDQKQQMTTDSPFSVQKEEDSTASEVKETPVPPEECSDNKDSNALISSTHSWYKRQMTKSESVWNIQALSPEDVSLLCENKSSLFLNNCPSVQENVLLEEIDILPALSLSNTVPLDEAMQALVFEYLFRKPKIKKDSGFNIVYDLEDISVTPMFDYALCTFRDETSLSFIRGSCCSEENSIPIFSCSPPTMRELTFSNLDYVLSSDWDETDDIPPNKIVHRAFSLGCDCWKALQGSHSWKKIPSIRKIQFHDKGSIWSRESGDWVFPVEAEKNTTSRLDPLITVTAEGGVCSNTSKLCRDVAVQQRSSETMQRQRQKGIFSILQQSDMCLVCIAFASWVLRSCDPQADDAWKAALLANVSALSAIQYLRKYVKKTPSKDHP